MDIQEKLLEKIGVIGADRLQVLWGLSYPHGTQYDKLFYPERYKTKEDVFTQKATREGFSKQAIRLFLKM